MQYILKLMLAVKEKEIKITFKYMRCLSFKIRKKKNKIIEIMGNNFLMSNMLIDQSMSNPEFSSFVVVNISW